MFSENDFATRIGLAYDLHAAGHRTEAENAYRSLLVERPYSVDVLFLLSSLLGNTGEALALARQAVGASMGLGGVGVDEASLLDHLARRLADQGQDAGDEADLLERALALNPGVAERWFRLAEARRRAGRLEAATTALRRYLELRPEDINAITNLGTLQFQLGDLALAVLSFESVLRRAPDHPECHNNLGNALMALDRHAEAREHYAAAIRARPDFGDAWLNLGDAFLLDGMVADAVGALQRAHALMSAHPLADLLLRAAYERLVPRWHFGMMNDRRRNEAYARALQNVIARERQRRGEVLVLDIGAGSGLLSMLAARAGAGRVVACEMVDVIADQARAIVAHNGYAGRVDVVAAKSTRLEVGKELPRRADVLVSEILDVGLLGESVVPVLSHARQELLADDAVMIPFGARVFMLPIESLEIFELFRVRNENTCGFDLTPFNRLSRADYDQLAVRRYRHAAIASATPVFDFDFRREIAHREKTLDFVAERGGDIHAWVFWFELQLDEDTTFDTGPLAPDSCWMQAVQVVERPLPVVAGQHFSVKASHTLKRIRFDWGG